MLKRISGLALSTFETIQNSYELAEKCIVDNIEGDFVECGVYAGAQCFAMMLALQKHSKRRTIHLFDSFEGIPKPGQNDIHIRALLGQGNGELVSTGISACSVEQIKKYCREFGFDETMMQFHKGWFQNTIKPRMVEKIALLRLDGDLYESTKCCLDNLADCVTKGGYIVIDDWALDGCNQAVREYWKKKSINPEYKVIPKSTPIFWKV